ncbi:MAG: MMPL family transporter [Spirochaetes bacterium]|nr:MMPL family transporter [Spirochaetota bacterium]
MKKILNRMLDYPKVVLIITLVVSIGLAVIMGANSRMETDLDKYMPQDHPSFIYSDKAEKWFNIKDGIIIAIENPAGIYNHGTLQKVKKLTKKLQRMKEIKKADVTSLYTAENIIGKEKSLDVSAFYKKVPKTKAGLEKIRKNVRNNEMIFGRLVSQDEKVTVIIAEIKDGVFSQEFYHRILNLVKSYQGPEKLHVAGRPIVEGTLAFLAPKDMKKMVPIVILVIILVLFFVLRSFKGMFFTLLVVLFSTIWAFGLMALLKIPIYAVSTMIPVMLIAIGVADGIHLYSHLHLFMKANPAVGKKEAISNLINKMWKPVMMTSVTTAIGFFSLLTSQVYPIKYFGIFTAFGVMMAMVFSLVLIPAALMAFNLPGWKKDKKEKTENKSTLVSGFLKGMHKHKYIAIMLTAAVIFISIIGMNKVWINSSFLEKFEKNSDIVLTDKFINENFGGTSTLNVILSSKKKNAFKTPEVLRALDRMQQDVQKKLKVVGNSFSIADYLKRLNKVLHADDEKYNVIPDTLNMNGQYLLLYEMSGDPDNLWKVVDYHYKKANLVFQLKNDDSKTLNSVIAQIKQYKPEFDKLGISINYAGSGYKALVFTSLILEGQISSLILSLIIVVILLSLMFKKITVGIIGSIPIMITAFISFGVMGLMNIALSTTTALISSIAIGVGIDYAVHFIERYKIYAEETGDKTLTAEYTMHHSGRAIMFNAAVVIAGFLVLLFSVFPPNRQLGGLVSLNMFTSFIGTMTIMYLMLWMSNVYFKKKKEK